MAQALEIIIRGKSPIKLEVKDNAIKNFIIYLNEKNPEWEEFVISNNFEKQIRVLKLKNELKQLPKTLSIGNLLVFLDKNYKDWHRFAISKIRFKEIEYSECEIGMLVRANTSNTNQYSYVENVLLKSNKEKEIQCNQEGKRVVFNSENCTKYKFSLLSQTIEKAQFEAIKWADYK